MAILEKIRKRSALLIVVIGIALFSFVISDFIQNRNLLKSSSVVGKVNGETILRENFMREVELASRRFGGSMSSLQVANQVWNQQVRNLLLEKQYKELGIAIEDDQVVELIKTNPYFSQDTLFQNEAGIFDEGRYLEFVADLQSNNPTGYQQWKLQEEAMVKAAKEQHYFNLVKASVYTTLSEGNYTYQAENDKVAIQYFQVPYSSIADSTITISKEEIKDYANTHKKEFKTEPQRSLQYVFFEEKPSPEDEENSKNEITALLEKKITYNPATKINDTVPGFRTTPNIADFVNANSDIPFDSTFVAKNDLPVAFADSLSNLTIGAVYGPYRDGEYFKISRMMAKKPNGVAQASHILIGYKGALQAIPSVTFTKEEAKAKAQELFNSVTKNPDTFADLARENSTDLQTGRLGGNLGFFAEGDMVKPFSDFVFSNAVGKIGIVETDFGFHIIHVTAKEVTLQIATIARKIEPSETTINNVFRNATEFEMAASEKEFAEAAKAATYNPRPVRNLKELDETIAGIGDQRSIVQWAFNADTEVGDVQRFNVQGGYAIVQLTEKIKKGVISSEDINVRIKPILLRQKKAALIISKNKGKTLEERAYSAEAPLRTASELTIKKLVIPGIGREPKVIGTALALQEGQTSGFIEGENGMYMLKVTGKEIAKPLDNYSTYATTQQTAARSRVNAAVYTALKEAATIKDNRAEFY